MLPRLITKCLLIPGDIRPSHKSLEVAGVFNPGAIAIDGEDVLLVRVAERPAERREGYTGLPRYAPGAGLVVDWIENDALTRVDPRVVIVNATGATRLTFISHLVTARSSDGRSLASVGHAKFVPETDYETYGVEDPRITKLDGHYYITYVAVSKRGIVTALASTSDFRSFKRHGIIFPPENKDVVIFPERIRGKYVALHRPHPHTKFSPPEIWIARSGNLIEWGDHKRLYGGESGWESGRVGAGCPPIATSDGWLEIYHGNQLSTKGIGIYSAAALLLDRDDPTIVRSITATPFMVPEADFECRGFVDNVVFPTGITEHGDTLRLYYGAADSHVGVTEYSTTGLLTALEECRANR